MGTAEETTRNTHHGHAIKRYRHTLGIKQDALAAEMNISQALVSFYEQKKEIEEDIIRRFAKALNISPELIMELEEDPVTIIIENNTFDKESIIAHVVENNTNNFNADPVDRIITLLHEKTALYERMLELEKEKNTLLEKLFKEKKNV